MKLSSWKLFVVVYSIIFSTNIYAQLSLTTPREKLLMDFDWRFHLGDANNIDNDFEYGSGWSMAKAGQGNGAMGIKFNDSTWRKVDLPHDWDTELPFVKDTKDWSVGSRGFKPLGRQYPANSIGWYRKSFSIPKLENGKRFEISFDGVFRDCKVWVNGYYLGGNLSGYSEFSYDITDYIIYDAKNVITVRVDATQSEGWFYEGAGIYRHVWLTKTEPLHIPDYGVFVKSEVNGKTAGVEIETKISNQNEKDASFDLVTKIFDKNGKEISSLTKKGNTVSSFKEKDLLQKLSVVNPELWSLENPALYKAVSIVIVKGKVVDVVETQFGIRTILWDKDKGFFLNGKHVKIQGVCCHQDHAGVGAALPDRLQYFRIEKLKEMGVNAYRTSHNPPTKELVEACDKLGMLVLNENRMIGSSPELLNQFVTLVKRDRNHPSVVIWSIGNEEWVVQHSDQAREIAKALIRIQKELDPTRTSTYAGNNGNQFEGINSVMPVRGFNYVKNTKDMDQYHRDHPDQPLMGTEEASTVVTRGIYETDSTKGYLRDYDTNTPFWGATAEYWWKFYDAREWLAGGFAWTGFDYRGEPTPFSWPCINSHFGIMDMCGFPKNHYYYYQSWWTDKPVLHISPHWNWNGREGKEINVWAHSNCESVELFLNGKSLGKKTMEKNSHLEWNVVYEPGILEARGLKNGKVITAKVETTGEPVSVILSPDRTTISADGEDVSIINITAIDEKGREVAIANNLIKFSLEGKGKIIGVGNGDPSSHEADKYLDGNYRRLLFNGKAQIIVQATKESGEIILNASSDGMKNGKVIINTGKCEPRAFVKSF
jgi:beta-galactosidase